MSRDGGRSLLLDVGLALTGFGLGMVVSAALRSEPEPKRIERAPGRRPLPERDPAPSIFARAVLGGIFEQAFALDDEPEPELDPPPPRGEAAPKARKRPAPAKAARPPKPTKAAPKPPKPAKAPKVRLISHRAVSPARATRFLPLERIEE